MKRLLFIFLIALSFIFISCTKEKVETNEENNKTSGTLTQESTKETDTLEPTHPVRTEISPSDFICPFETEISPTDFFCGEEAINDPFFYSSAKIDSEDYSLGSIVNIEISLFNDAYCVISEHPELFLDGDLYAKIDESPYYNIISEPEQIYHDFSFEKNIRHYKDNLVKFNFQIKFNEYVDTLDLYKYIVFRFKFNYDIEGAIESFPYYYCYDEFKPEEEYFLVLPELAFKIENNSVHIKRLYSLAIDYYNIIDANTIYPGSYFEILFYFEMNKKYEDGLINADDYLSSLRAFMTNEMVYINLDQDNIYYIYRNIYAIFDKNVIDEKTMNNYNDGNYFEVALKLLLILVRDKNIIDDEKFNLELDYLENNHTTNYVFTLKHSWKLLTEDIWLMFQGKEYGLPVMYVVNKDK